jgi:hypothetical protein
MKIRSKESSSRKPVSDETAVWRRTETVDDAGGLGDVLPLDVTAQLRRTGKVQMVLPPAPLNVKQSAPRSVALLHCRRRQGLQQINQRALAKRIGRTENAVARLMRLAFIAPHIIEAMQEGKHGLSLSDLTNQVLNIPGVSFKTGTGKKYWDRTQGTRKN